MFGKVFLILIHQSDSFFFLRMPKSVCHYFSFSTYSMEYAQDSYFSYIFRGMTISSTGKKHDKGFGKSFDFCKPSIFQKCAICSKYFNRAEVHETITLFSYKQPVYKRLMLKRLENQATLGAGTS